MTNQHNLTRARVLAVIYAYCAKHTIGPSQQEIARAVGCSDHTVRRCLVELVETAPIWYIPGMVRGIGVMQ